MFAAAGLAVAGLDACCIGETRDEDVLEAFSTFEANALAKARYFFARSGGCPTIADDSGLEVDVLGGRPGVSSKRWSGRSDLRGAELDAANNATLLEALRAYDRPAARYVCAAAYVADGAELVTRGETYGHIVRSGRGTGGFGYDPYFFSSELGHTFGESTPSEKERVSHRGRAFRALIEAIGASR
jgi:XTP/dITP diphosphohydrolase